mmetsp:Transcript_27333/g.57905  ORF Transcript_27333/g.57905 Transcript_27333/m.57905 type:complete len:339 (+) Transcript_27333:73-1089(+)
MSAGGVARLGASVRGQLARACHKYGAGGARAAMSSSAGGSSDLTPGARLRALVQDAASSKQPLQIVGAINAYSALMAEKKGFKALYLSGGGVALSSLGVPDLGITTLEDVCIDARRITRACPATPLLVDIDTGFGTTIFNVRRTIQDVEAAGVAGVHMEDQVVAKRCGHRPNKQIVSTEEMVHRITAAVDARANPDFFIMARTDALATEGLASSIERCKAYVAAGADALFIEAVTELDQYKAFSEAIPGVPLLSNLTEFGKTPLWSLPELAESGACMALYPLSAFRAMSKGADTVFSTLLDKGSVKPCMDALHTREQTYEVIDYHKHEQMLDKFQSNQ